jgi:predicted SPOUT superfamily RNA methylase MTH1
MRRKSLNKKILSIAIPASVVSDTPHLREKTSKIGLIGRAAAIFRVDEIIIYQDDLKVNQATEMNLIVTLLEYMETPQYLRKRLFGLKPELQFAGVLPPLRTPHHPLNRRMKNLKIGEYREGVIISKIKEGTLIDIGVEKPALSSDRLLPIGKRVTVKVTAVRKHIEVETVNHGEIPVYWGYKVTMEKNFLKLGKENFDLIVATSKYGVPFEKVKEKMADRWNKASTILVAFGAPTRGLYEIFKSQGFNLDDSADFVVNTIPKQGTETIRSEEALIASLTIFNMQFNL